MKDLEEAWMGGTRQMAMALPPEHPLFDVALRELSRRGARHASLFEGGPRRAAAAPSEGVLPAPPLPTTRPSPAPACLARPLCRLVPDAAGRPALQQELEGVVQRLKELLYLLKVRGREGCEPGRGLRAPQQDLASHAVPARRRSCKPPCPSSPPTPPPPSHGTVPPQNLPESMKSPLEAQQEGAEPLEQQPPGGGGGGSGEEFLP